ncbi:GNAT family N-acetyltransferase [Spirosoma endophyticum]|uniref:Protein N-acetyltransferase, RimJ/RimL family n=1 Tax=Spirosoma endophyticum TaxID=662367 RepID=A0A1I2H216_9BACT|nr:GNAT family N-acetyltransferase [Spirosoma endophyticum]SFF23742.1 Protein N-acetyltransferase, RimJ/RimL family [Spirosoma endophyticum]
MARSICYEIGRSGGYAGAGPLVKSTEISTMTIDCTTFTIRSWQESDALNLADYANDKEIWLNLRDRFPYPYTATDAADWVTFAIGVQPETNFAIAINGKAVGGIGLILGEDIQRCSAEVGYWLGRAYWGKGIISEALIAFTAYAFRRFELTRLYAVPYLRNPASMRVLEKAGYQYEGTMRQSAIKDKEVLDPALYAFVPALGSFH